MISFKGLRRFGEGQMVQGRFRSEEIPSNPARQNKILGQIEQEAYVGSKRFHSDNTIFFDSSVNKLR